MENLIECQNCMKEIGPVDVACWHCGAINERSRAAIHHMQSFLLKGLDIGDPYIWVWQEALLRISVSSSCHGDGKWLVIDFSSAAPEYRTNDEWYFRVILYEIGLAFHLK